MIRSAIYSPLRISIHALRVEGDIFSGDKNQRFVISIHALRVEGDRTFRAARDPRTPISIHALRVEGDDFMSVKARGQSHFYPRPPGGGRPLTMMLGFQLLDIFLSTPSGWRATAISRSPSYPLLISIHALRVEGDDPVWETLSTRLYFYPRPPGGGRRRFTLCNRFDGVISIHALRVEGDSKNGQSFHLFLRKREKNLPF